MNELMIFSNPEFGEIRTVEIDGEPWLVGKDVVQALGYANPQKALADHVDPEDKRQGDGVTIRDPMGREQHPTVINESGLYSLVLSSKLPGAKKFKRWVTSEVLPSIRKTGTYGLPQDYPSALRALADTAEKLQQTEQDLSGERAKSRELASVAALALIGPDARKACYYDELVAKNLLTSIRETANLLKVPEKEFVRWMLAGKFLYRGRRDKLRPYANRIEEGLFELKETSDDGTGRARVQTLVTPKGREAFLQLMDKGVFGILYRAIKLEDYMT